jgi:hypothetical protein
MDCAWGFWLNLLARTIYPERGRGLIDTNTNFYLDHFVTAEFLPKAFFQINPNRILTRSPQYLFW